MKNENLTIKNTYKFPVGKYSCKAKTADKKV